MRFNDRHTHIDRVRTHPDRGDSMGASQEHDRGTIIALIKNNVTFVTIFRGDDGKWKEGQPVYIIKVNGTEFIKTVDNGKAVDNLDNLPEF